MGSIGGDGARIFRIDDGNVTALKNVSLSGLTLTGGDLSGDGGAILNFENLSIVASRITDNAVTSGQGGGRRRDCAGLQWPPRIARRAANDGSRRRIHGLRGYVSRGTPLLGPARQ